MSSDQKISHPPVFRSALFRHYTKGIFDHGSTKASELHLLLKLQPYSEHRIYNLYTVYEQRRSETALKLLFNEALRLLRIEFLILKISVKKTKIQQSISY